MITIPEPRTEDEIAEAYGKRLARLRGKRSQREVAELVGVSQPSIVKAESGSLKTSEELLAKLERLYEIREPLPMAPKHPLRRREWVAIRNAGLQNRKVPDAA